MGMVVFTGQLDFEQHATVRVGVRADGDGPLTEIAVTGIIDTASKQCVINVGVFAEGVFAPTSNGILVDGIGHSFDSRHREMVVRLMHEETTKESRVPVYEMPLGTFPDGAPVMLIGRTILNQGVLVYDGTSRTWRMTFSSD